MTPFKIGSIYRQNDGKLMRLDATAFDVVLSNGDPIRAPAGIAFAIRLENGVPMANNGHRLLSNGRYTGAQGSPEYECHLIPGELNAQGEPIAPTFYCAAETLNPCDKMQVLPAIAALKAGAVWWFDASEPQPEKARPRLTWADSKPFDKFADFAVCSDTATPDHAYSHYLTRVADAGAQVSAQHGSAHLVR